MEDIHQRDNILYTALLHAIFHENIEAIRVLLANGADQNCKYYTFMKTNIFKLQNKNIVEKKIFEQHDKFQFKEWRPWNHIEYSSKYRQALRSMVVLAKA